jgi:hypothetical protein
VLDRGLGSQILGGLVSLALLLPSLAVAVRRLHDAGRTGWWLLLGLIPIIGWIVLLVFYVQDSQGPNAYGPSLKAYSGYVVRRCGATWHAVRLGRRLRAAGPEADERPRHAAYRAARPVRNSSLRGALTIMPGSGQTLTDPGCGRRFLQARPRVLAPAGATS